MRIKRFIAPDMRSALRMVREEQGPDAVILSNRQTEGGVEVVAATDYDEALVQQTLRTMSTPAGTQPVPSPIAATAAPQPAPRKIESRIQGRAVFRIGDAPASDRTDTPQTDIAEAAASLAATTAMPAAQAAERAPSRLEQMMAAFKPARTTQFATPEHAAPLQPAPEQAAQPPSAQPRAQRISVRVDDAVDMPSFADALAKVAMPQAPMTADLSAQAASLDADMSADLADEAAIAAALATGPRAAGDAGAVGAHRSREGRNAMPLPDASSAEATAHLRLVDADPAVAALRAELSAMRQVIERELGSFAIERLRGSPARAAAMDSLTAFGCDQAFAQQIAQRIDPTLSAAAIGAPVRSELAGLLPVMREEAMEHGGVIALLGPTGAGKTTTIAKLAARYAARHRARDVALVTTDTERTGAREQLHALGRRLGITVCDADGADGLSRALDQLADYPLVLVDTAGHGLRDRALLRQILWVRATSRVRSLLVLPANAHPNDLNELLRRYRPAAPEGVVLTKLDESVAPGAALSVLVQHGLPLAYTTSGQCVPEDIEPADAQRLAQLLELPRDVSDTHQDNQTEDSRRHAFA